MNFPKFSSRGCEISASIFVLLYGFLATAAFGQGGFEPAPKTDSAQPAQVCVTNLVGIVIVPNSDDVILAGMTNAGVLVKGPSFLQRSDFEQLLSRHLNAPLTDTAAKQIQVEIIEYCRKHGHYIVDVFYREQEIVEGTIQIAVIEGKIGNVTVENEGHKWFSDSFTLGTLHLRSGDTINKKHLDSDLSWLNRNGYQSLGTFSDSFRDVQLELTPGGDLGGVDAKIKVHDRFPLRPFVGYEDSGIELVGKDRVFGGFNWANVFGLDHRLNYQYTTDTDFDRFRAHAASYVMPLPWHNELVLFGAYADVDPDYSLIGLPAFSSKGTVYQLSARYTIPLRRLRNYDHEITAGFDYKHTDTPTVFLTPSASSALAATNPVEVAQFTLEYHGLLEDRWGKTAFSMQGVYSPGDLTDYNTDADYDQFARGTRASYLYGRLELRRETMLPAKFSWMLRGLGQISDSKLTPSETFGLGGYATVRGYDERTIVGDHGWLVVNELRTPQFVLGNLTGKENVKDWIQALIFCDYGGVIQKDPGVGNRQSEELLSIGAGVRYQMADNLHFRFDYGYQLDRDYLSDPNNLEDQSRGRVHIGVELSY